MMMPAPTPGPMCIAAKTSEEIIVASIGPMRLLSPGKRNALNKISSVIGAEIQVAKITNHHALFSWSSSEVALSGGIRASSASTAFTNQVQP